MFDRLLAADKAAIAEEVKGWADALSAKPDVMLRQRGIIQLACAAVHALTGESSANWAALETQEQQLLQHALDGMMHTQSVSVKMCRLTLRD